MKQTPLVIIAGCLIVATASLGIFYYSTTLTDHAPISEPGLHLNLNSRKLSQQNRKQRLKLISRKQPPLQAIPIPSLRQQLKLR